VVRFNTLSNRHIHKHRNFIIMTINIKYAHEMLLDLLGRCRLPCAIASNCGFARVVDFDRESLAINGA
jgi:hypothetical protein